MVVIILMSRSSALRVSFVSYIFLRARTPLHFSAEVGYLEMCRLLLQSNADIEAKNWR
jgi:ankyrin repeat protein